MSRTSETSEADFGLPESSLGPRLLVALGGISLLVFEMIYRWLGEPTGPLWLRGSVISLCLGYVVAMQLAPSWRRFAYAGAGAVAVAATAENIFRMHLVAFTLTHSLPMLVVVAGATYAFRHHSHMALYLIGSAVALTATLLLTPEPEVPPTIYIASVWVFCLLTFVVFGARVREHNRVRTQERILSGVFEGSFGGLLLFKGAGLDLVLANDRARALLGANEHEALRTRLLQNLGDHLGVPPDDVARNALAGGPWNEEVPFVLGARHAWMDVWMRRIELDGSPMVLVGLYDVTERRQALAALTRNELFLERSQRIGSVGSWDMNLRTGAHTWSPELFRIYGIEGQPQPTVEQALTMLDPEAEAQCREAFGKAARDGERVALDLRTRINGGEVIWLRLTGEVVDYQGERHLLGITQDVSADKRAEQEIIRARDLAEQALKVRSEFLANMSHEIRTPMNGVIGMTSLLMDSELNSQQRELLETIKVSGESLLHLINDILDFSKIDAGRIDLEQREFATESLFAGALEPLAVQASEKGFELTLEIDAAVPPRFLGDVTRLRQIVVNLVHNAIKFTKEGRVSVHVFGIALPEDRFELVIGVEDTGIGIAEQDVGRLFDAFVQQDASTTRRFGGTGLGLSISQRLAELMGGRIEVSSTLGAGSTFRLRLPLPRGAGGGSPAAQDWIRDKQVLLVEPGAASRAVITRLLEHSHARVFACPDPESAATVLTRERIDVAVLDHAAAAALRMITTAAPAHPRTVVIAFPGDRGDSGADAKVIRPVRPTALLNAIAPAFPAASAAASAASGAEEPYAKQASLRVLLAEDNEVNRMVASRMLTRLGCELEIVGDGSAAVDAVRARVFDVVIMDVQMPVLDGLEATRRIRALAGIAQPRIIALTANAMEDDRSRCMAAGMDDFLAKPITMRALGDALSRNSTKAALRAYA